ncbi:hypothetical protein [Streptomyces abyssomicinicus]|uniref:hypothetical protein n=1 Tax=Streptomyces abyssomicinicus TaxID=574929 RepID=UPI00124FACAA|nr:hypothetical protein [Streptomyces abyssomicinicus]
MARQQDDGLGRVTPQQAPRTSGESAAHPPYARGTDGGEAGRAPGPVRAPLPRPAAGTARVPACSTAGSVL